MRRFLAAAYVILGATTLACSGPPGDTTESTNSALSACDTAGCEVVTLTGFDRETLVLTGVNAAGEELSIRYTADTEALPADLGTYEPPDPCFAQATAWNHQIGPDHTEPLIERLAHFATFRCNASVTLGEGNLALSFRPVPYPPQPT